MISPIYVCVCACVSMSMSRVSELRLYGPCSCYRILPYLQSSVILALILNPNASEPLFGHSDGCGKLVHLPGYEFRAFCFLYGFLPI